MNRIVSLMVSTNRGYIIRVTETGIMFEIYHLFSSDDVFIESSIHYTTVFDVLSSLS